MNSYQDSLKEKRQIPSVGRVVHYHTSAYNQPLAAWVCSVAEPGNPDSPLNLLVLDPFCASMPLIAVPYGEDQHGHWSWPPYVAPVLVDKPETDADSE